MEYGFEKIPKVMVQMFTSMNSIDVAKKIVKEMGDLIYIVQHQEWR